MHQDIEPNNFLNWCVCHLESRLHLHGKYSIQQRQKLNSQVAGAAS